MITSPILVIGALGNVGAELVKRLQAEGRVVRAADLNADQIRARFGGSVEAVRFDFADPSTYPDAFSGVERMFLLRPPQITDVQSLMLPAIQTARRAGVRHAVFLSLIGIERNTQVPHYQVELALKANHFETTFLRCSFFMQNLTTVHRREIAERDEIFVPVGRARTSFIDVRDIAAVAARALTEQGHANQNYDLTGGEALDYWQAADILTETLGRRITYRNPHPAHFFFETVRRGTPLMFAYVQTRLYVSTRNGMANGVTPDVERLTGRKPISFRQFAEDYKECWQSAQ